MEGLYTASEAERATLADILSHAFAFPLDDAPKWFERAGHGNVRVFYEDDALIGGLIVIPMGQYFGGRAVPTYGVAGVGIAPEQRGSGAGTRMMRALISELHARGVALSTLYPATVPLYQRAGYERAGARYAVSVRPQELPVRHDPAFRVVNLATVGDAVTGPLYARQARTRDGSLDRGDYVWGRVNNPRQGVVRRVGVASAEGVEGYVVLMHRQEEGFDTTVTVVDAVAVTARAAQELLVVLGGYRSLAREVRWYGAPQHALVQRLRDRQHTITLTDFWMLRVVHVGEALRVRGYNPTLAATLGLTVTDDVVPANEGSWRLDVSHGEATVTREALEGITLDVRALAALYTGFRSARALADDGLLTGGDEAIATADALFAGTAPSMGDMF